MSQPSVHHQALTITNDLSALPRVRRLVESGVEQGGFPPQYLNRLQIAVDEAVTNIVAHGYADQPPGKATIELTLDVDRDTFHMVIEDYGQTFDPEDVADVDIQRQVREGQGRGLGVFLMRRIMDRIEYHAETGTRNRLVLVKYRGPA